ncbi:ATP synthase F0 subunit C [bacterium]|nr:ATP synthase F0 subunit C [bacterium]
MIDPASMRYVGVGIATALSSIGSGIGMGIAISGTIDATIRQALSQDHITRIQIVGLIFIETTAVLSLVFAFMMLFGKPFVGEWGPGLAELGLGLSIGLAAFSVGIASSWVVRASGNAVARQPFFAQKITTFMVVLQSLIEAPLMFAFIVMLLIRGELSEHTTLAEGIKFFAAAMSIGLGAIGPSIGQGFLSSAGAEGIGKNRDAYGKIFSFAIISEAFIETPVIFALVISITLIFQKIPVGFDPMSALIFLGAPIAISVGAAGSAISTSRVAATSCLQVALNTDLYSSLMRLTLLSQVVIETCGIFALVVALMIISGMS